MRTRPEESNRPILLVILLLISSLVPFFYTSEVGDALTNNHNQFFSSMNQSSNPYVLPLGVLSPWHNETPHIIEIEYNGTSQIPINYSSFSKSFQEFHIIRLRLPMNNNQVIDLYIEESPNQDKCRTHNGMYSNFINMYLLRTDGSNLVSEANGYLIEYFNPLGSNWLLEGQIYGEWMNSTNTNSWRLDIFGNSSNNTLSIKDLGITNNRGVNQSVNNSIPSNIGHHNGIENLHQLQYRLVRMTLMYERAKVEDICRSILQAENILRNNFGIQLYLERYYDLTTHNGFSDPDDLACNSDPLLADIGQHRENWSQYWRDSQSPFGLRGNASSPHFDSIDTVFYYGSLNDHNINYSGIFDNEGRLTKLGCSTSSFDEYGNFIGFGVGWALMDFHHSDQWNSVHLFTQLISKAIGGDYSNSHSGMSGLVGGKPCRSDVESNNQFNSVMVQSVSYNHNNNSKNNGEIINEECYGIIPYFSSENSNSIFDSTSSVPFIHVQPDWAEHWRYRWSFFGDLRLRQWYIQSFNAIENDSVYGINGDPSILNRSTIAGPDPIWRIRWTMERTIWVIPIWNQTSYWQNDIWFYWWQTGVRAYANGNGVNLNGVWLDKCAQPMVAQNLSLGQLLGYADGWSQNTSNLFGPINQHIYGTAGWGVISCHDGSIYLQDLTEFHIPNPNLFIQNDQVHWIVFPSIQYVTIPWLNSMGIRNVHFDHIALMWVQSS